MRRCFSDCQAKHEHLVPIASASSECSGKPAQMTERCLLASREYGCRLIKTSSPTGYASVYVFKRGV